MGYHAVCGDSARSDVNFASILHASCRELFEGLTVSLPKLGKNITGIVCDVLLTSQPTLPDTSYGACVGSYEPPKFAAAQRPVEKDAYGMHIAGRGHVLRARPADELDLDLFFDRLGMIEIAGPETPSLPAATQLSEQLVAPGLDAFLDRCLSADSAPAPATVGDRKDDNAKLWEGFGDW